MRSAVIYRTKPEIPFVCQTAPCSDFPFLYFYYGIGVLVLCLQKLRAVPAPDRCPSCFPPVQKKRPPGGQTVRWIKIFQLSANRLRLRKAASSRSGFIQQGQPGILSYCAGSSPADCRCVTICISEVAPNIRIRPKPVSYWDRITRSRIV